MILNLTKTLNFASGRKKLMINTSIEAGTFVAISGPSGSGKTTLLRLIAGLSIPDEGFLKINDKIWLDSQNNVNLAPQNRRVGYVFQNYALFPNMSVEQNLNFALEKDQSKAIIGELLDIMELSKLGKKYPNQLSGGQQQRVALARALVRKPPILLLDEPLSSLDNTMRDHLQNYLIKIHRKYNLTILMVSHDLPEIIKLANHVIVLKEGEITEAGLPSEILLKAKNTSDWQLYGELISITPVQSAFRIDLKIGDTIVQLEKETIDDLKVGQQIKVQFKAFQPIILPDQ